MLCTDTYFDIDNILVSDPLPLVTYARMLISRPVFGDSQSARRPVQGQNVSVPLRILISPEYTEYTESDLERNRTLEPPNGAFEYGIRSRLNLIILLDYCELLLKCSELVIYVPSSLKFRVGLNVLPDALS